jgi:hypothetical protein
MNSARSSVQLPPAINLDFGPGVLAVTLPERASPRVRLERPSVFVYRIAKPVPFVPITEDPGMRNEDLQLSPAIASLNQA